MCFARYVLSVRAFPDHEDVRIGYALRLIKWSRDRNISPLADTKLPTRLESSLLVRGGRREASTILLRKLFMRSLMLRKNALVFHGICAS